MGIIDRLFRGRLVDGEKGRPGGGLREGVPLGMIQEKPMLEITDLAKEKIRAVLEAQDPPADSIRVEAIGPGKFSMSLEPGGQPGQDDTVLPYDGFRVFVDAQSAPMLEGAGLDYLEAYGGGGFKFTAAQRGPARPQPKGPPEGPEGEIWRQIQEVLDEQINPAVAGHGGHVSLIDYKDGTVFVEMGGGCQGCGMASVTLKHGVERLLKEGVPEVREILDVTDHAGGRNPYYAATTK